MNQKEQMSLNKLVTIFGTEIPFVRLLSILSLLGVGLFFVGWVYRWAYFSFFQLQISTINLSPQSFLFSPLQVFFSDSSRTFLTIGSLILTGIWIYLFLWLYNLLITQAAKAIDFCESKLRRRSTAPLSTSGNKIQKFLKFLKSLLQRLLLNLLRFGKTRTESLQMLQGLIEEIIAVSLLILVFYWLARTQGIHDARRDASPKSTLPAITLVIKETQLPIGGKLEPKAASAVPSVKGFSIIGDRGMFESLQDKEETNFKDPQNPRVWRLLLEKDGWFYLFYNLPANAPKDQRPLVLALKDGQMLILSPEPTKP